VTNLDRLLADDNWRRATKRLGWPTHRARRRLRMRRNHALARRRRTERRAATERTAA
jgi:hypothetical protein